MSGKAMRQPDPKVIKEPLYSPLLCDRAVAESMSENLKSMSFRSGDFTY